jgi:hypothetical protein
MKGSCFLFSPLMSDDAQKDFQSGFCACKEIEGLALRMRHGFHLSQE